MRQIEDEQNRTSRKMSRCWITRGVLTVGFLLAVYTLTAPLILPKVFDTKSGKIVYAPILYSLRKDWWGRDIVDWYYFRVWRMQISIAREPSGPQ